MASLDAAAIGLTVKAEEDIFADSSERVLRAKQGNTVLFRINVATKLKKLKRAYSLKMGVSPEAVLYTFAGMTILDTHSASDLYMIDQDLILVKHEPSFLARVSRIPSTRVQDFSKLLHNEEFSDVVLVVGRDKTRIPASKAILCARSDKFRGMFSENFAEGRAAIESQEMLLPDCQPQLMRVLLQYLYTDEVEVPEDAEEAASLLMLAEEYMLPALKRDCEIALLPQVKERTVCLLLQTADMYSAPVLKSVCKQYLLDNFDSKPNLGEELQKCPHLLLEIAHAAVLGNKRRRLQ